MNIDMYRIGLFKKKIKSAIPEVSDLRFGSSRNREYLFISIWLPYYDNHKEVADAVISGLNKKRISHTVERIEWLRGSPVRCISIPIDQEALPERKRS